MKTKNLTPVLLPLLAIITFSTLVFGQGESGVTFANGITLSRSTDYGNILAAEFYAHGMPSKDNELLQHQTFINKSNKTYTGYDLEIIPQEDLTKFKVIIKPLSIKSNNKILRGKNLTFIPIPKYPDEVLVDDGDIITLDVFENPQTKEKITDYIIVTRNKSVGPRFASRYIPKDFSINDVQIAIYEFDFKVNGKSLHKSGGGASGGNVGIYLPGKGRFIFSPFPREGYGLQKIGIITNNKLSFSYNGEDYEITANSPILGRGGKWHCWVLVQPDFIPTRKTASKSEVSMQSGGIEWFFQ